MRPHILPTLPRPIFIPFVLTSLSFPPFPLFLVRMLPSLTSRVPRVFLFFNWKGKTMDRQTCRIYYPVKFPHTENPLLSQNHPVLPANISVKIVSHNKSLNAVYFLYLYWYLSNNLHGITSQTINCTDNAVRTLTLTWLMSYIYGAPILDVSRSHTTTQHSR